jgi:hypothetical protein
MRKIFLHLFVIFLFVNVNAQKEKFDIATFTPPQGWQRIDSNGIKLFFNSKTTNGLTSFCQIFLYPSQQSKGPASSDFQSEWNKHVTIPTGSTEKPKTETEKTPEGWEVITGYANINHLGVTFTCILVTAFGFGKEMTVQVNLAGNDYMPEVQKFLDNLDLDSKATSSLNDSKKNMTKQVNVLNDYQFIAPERWYTQKGNDFILLSQTQSPNYGCTITILLPQPSSGNLENDTRNFFNQMYQGWQYRSTGENKEDVSKGYTLQGLEYYMIEAPMQKSRPDGYYYDYENGQALVISLGNQIAIIAGRHQRGEMTCFCKYQYEYWNRFFNSFTVNNISPQKTSKEDVSKRIVGSWKSMGGNALTQYIFAANGRYQFIGAYTTTSRISWNTIEMKTSGFKGDGSYTINSNKLTTRKDSDKNKPDIVQYRFEKVNHGSTGWKDRLYILDKSVVDGKIYEVCYEKEVKE